MSALFRKRSSRTAGFDRKGSDPADIVVANARIFTSGSSEPYARALAAKDGRFVFVGDNDGAADFTGPETRLVDAGGRTVTPGFVDNHCHVLWIGGLTALMTTDLFFCETVDEIKDVVLRQASEHPDSLIVMAQGWKQQCIPEGVCQLELLDSWIGDRPVALMSYMATGWVNSRMLELMQARNPEALARLVPETDENGAYNGLLRHFHAFNPLDFVTIDELGPGVREMMFEAMGKVLKDAVAVGVTTMDDVQVYKPYLPMILEFRDRGGLDDVRVRCGFYLPNSVLEDEDSLKADLQWWKELGRTESDEHLILGSSVKLYIDGVASNHTSLNFEPYADLPDSCGEAVWSQDDFDRVIELVHTMGLQACTHCCGDAGINRVVNSYERVYDRHGKQDLRHRADHCSRPADEDIARIARLGIQAAMQPAHFFGDETVEKALGHKRLQRFQPWRSLERAGAEVSFGSDWCAGPINPVYGLLIAAKRMNYHYTQRWGPDEKITIDDAIRHWTIGSARALKMEDEIGSIEVGKCADFVLFNTSPLKLSSWRFLLTHDLKLGAMDGYVDMTATGGKVVYEKEGASL